jgi:hypothetical protein
MKTVQFEKSIYMAPCGNSAGDLAAANKKIVSFCPRKPLPIRQKSAIIEETNKHGK